MQSVLIKLIVTLIKSLMDNGLVDTIQDLVEKAVDLEIPGAEKREYVLNTLGKLASTTVAASAPFLINLALEALVAQYKIEND